MHKVTFAVILSMVIAKNVDNKKSPMKENDTPIGWCVFILLLNIWYYFYCFYKKDYKIYNSEGIDNDHMLKMIPLYFF